MNRWRDKTFGDLADALRLYRPFVGAVVALALVAIILPGRDSGTGVAAGGDTSGVQTFETVDGTTGGTAADGTSSPTVTLPDGSTAPAADLSSSGGGGGTGGSSGGGAQPQGAIRVSDAAATSASCDPATGRVKIPSIYAPPCVPDFSGDNGGATYQGVTADSIRIAVYLPQEDPASGAILSAAGIDDSIEEVQATFQGYADFFERHYETYGREVELVFVQASGADADDASARADAIKVATEIKAFMSWGGRVLTNAYQDELAARGVPCICTKAPPVEYGLDHAPYYYSQLMFSSQAYVHRAEYIGKMVYGRKAQWAGDVLFQQQQRKVGLVYTETAAGDIKPGVDFFEQELGRYGAKLDDRIGVLLDIPRMQEQARTIIARLKEKGITTVALATTFLDPIFLTGEATRQGYFPEWLVIGSALTDTAVWARLYDQSQWSHAFGISQLPGRLVSQKTDPWALWQWEYDGATPPADDTFAVMYAPTWLFFTGLHLAGPDLNPTTFRNGLFSYPPTGGGFTTPMLSFGNHGFWQWDDYSPFDDATEVWWDTAARGPDETGADGQGMYRYVDGGKRYLPGQWPQRDAKAFDPAGTVVIYDEVPEGERAPAYEHQPH
jgi:hypothetical protein